MSLDKKTMKIFFEGMQGNMLSGSYTSKIITTPMGPFKWNDVIELWENVNNGMVMNNMSFQDMMTMGYETLGGGADYIEVPDRSIELSSDFGNLESVNTGNIIRWASKSGPQATLANATSSTVMSINRPVQITIVDDNIIGSGLSSLRWSKNSTTTSSAYTAPITVNNGDVLRIGAGFPRNLTGFPLIGSGNIVIKGPGSTTISSIPYSYDIPI